MPLIVDLGIPFNENNQDTVMKLSNEIEELLEELGGLTASSGGGFGYRDIQIEFEKGSENQVEKIIKLKLDEHSIKIGDNPDDKIDAYLSIYDKEEKK